MVLLVDTFLSLLKERFIKNWIGCIYDFSGITSFASASLSTLRYSRFFTSFTTSFIVNLLRRKPAIALFIAEGSNMLFLPIWVLRRVESS
jgi:hypothetical protein